MLSWRESLGRGCTVQTQSFRHGPQMGSYYREHPGLLAGNPSPPELPLPLSTRPLQPIWPGEGRDEFRPQAAWASVA